MEIKQIPISLVAPSPMNPRKTFDEGELKELAGNIEKQGLLQPITVRPIADKSKFAASAGVIPEYEIVCGERRFRAVSMLNDEWADMDAVAPQGHSFNRFAEISAIVRDMTDEDAFDAMITENLLRKDVDPMEEAFAFFQLHKSGKSTEEIAARFGKSERFVTERIKLNSLVPELMVAVKDGKMPIVAAQIICKLDDEQQRAYHNSYSVTFNGYTKQTAQAFVDDLFMNLNKSLWHRSDEDFEGGCNRKCSDCPLNTVNHGCLFYEMKSEGPGRCTDREKFKAKSVAFVMREIERQADGLVKAGEPLEYGKAVIAITDVSYGNEKAKNFKQQVREMVASRGFEIVSPDKAFSSRCWYRSDDERTIEKLKSGEAYRVISLFNFDDLVFNEEFWYVKKSSDGGAQNGLPVNVAAILEKLQNEQNGLESKLVCECAKAMYANSIPTNEPLTELEIRLFCLLVLQNNHRLVERLGIKCGQVLYTKEAYEYMDQHPDIFNQCVRATLQSKVSLGNNPELKMAEPMLDDLGALWCAEEYQKAKDGVMAKHEKAVAKMTQQLADLGYGTDGKPLVSKQPIESADIISEFKRLKARYPEALLLFRKGDFYVLFNEDADEAASILGLTTAPWRENHTLNHCGFVHHAIDTMLPKLIKAGKRVAICETEK